MATPMKDALVHRLAQLQDQRAKVVQTATAKVAELDKWLAALTSLLANWDTLTIDQAFAAADQAGLHIRIDS